MKLRLSIDIAARRRKAEEQINQYFAIEYAQNAHVYAAHERKRRIAESVLAGNGCPQEFVEEARLSGVSPQDLARTIVSKPDEFLERELKRRKLILAARKCRDQADIDELLQAIPTMSHTPSGVDRLLRTFK